MNFNVKAPWNRIVAIAIVLLVLVTFGSVVQGSIGPKTIFQCLQQNCLVAVILLVLGTLSVWGGNYVSHLKKLEETNEDDTAG